MSNRENESIINVEYRYLNEDDQLALLEFSKKANHSDRLTNWLQTTLITRSQYSIICAEFYNGVINSIIAACSWSYWVGYLQEYMPMWLGIRTDRLQNFENFNKFMDKLSTLVTNHFEPLGYFQHYIVRKLPKKFNNLSDIARFTNRAWGQGPYTPTVECVIDNIDAYNTSPTLFKTMIGPYKNPVVVLFMNITDNSIREARQNEIRNNS